MSSSLPVGWCGF
jgi:hypothetical protein